MTRRLLLVCGVLLLASCSNVCGPASSQAPSASPSAKVPGADASCKSEPSSHSLNSNTPTSFTVSNQTSETLTLFWLNFQGQRVKYFDLPPGTTKSQGTFLTHPWVVADPQGACIRLFLDATQITIS